MQRKKRNLGYYSETLDMNRELDQILKKARDTKEEIIISRLIYHLTLKYAVGYKKVLKRIESAKGTYKNMRFNKKKDLIQWE